MQPRNDEWECAEPSALEGVPAATSSTARGVRPSADDDAETADDAGALDAECPAGEVPTAKENLPLREKLVLGFDALRRMLKLIADLRKVDAVPHHKPPVRPA